MDKTGCPPDENARATRWLSLGFEALLAALADDPEDRDAACADFDVVVVGSGYGGAIAASQLAANRGTQTICVLERGREYLPGAFPSRMADLAEHVRFTAAKSAKPSGYREGLFDVRLGADLCTLVANGVGGGSLINAGVLTMPVAGIFDEQVWPTSLRGPQAYSELASLSTNLAQRLGATGTVGDSSEPLPQKYKALNQLMPAKFSPLPITVALKDGERTAAGVDLTKCARCGDCTAGCNHNAKVSLDTTFLAFAVPPGAEIYSGVTVLRIEKTGTAEAPLWQLHLVHTDDALRRRQGQPFVLRARQVVLAAGTLGSAEILMRSERKGLRFSPRLGQRFSANGDLLAAAYDTQVEANCVGDEMKAPDNVPVERRVGPTITGMVDLRNDDGFVIQDLGVPGPLRRMFEEVITTSASLHLLAEADTLPHRPDDQSGDPCMIDSAIVRNTHLLVMIGRDTADGVLQLHGGTGADAGDGVISIHWPTLRDHPPFVEQHAKLQHLLDASPLRGRLLPNPMWQLLPSKLQDLLGGETGPLLTVHPLGGCAMGESCDVGVVDDCGRVFDAELGGAVHKGLIVLDGSIVPTSLGINPALTIACLAMRAIEKVRCDWGFDIPAQARELRPRPFFRVPQPVVNPRKTEVEVLERLSGPMRLNGVASEAHVELTMRFDKIEALALTRSGATLELGAAHGRLRVFDHEPRGDEEPRDDAALFVAEVSGSLRVFHREESTACQRRWPALWAWFRNRGLRDTVLWAIDRVKGEGPPPTDDSGWLKQGLARLCSAWALASRAGSVRLLDYDLTVGELLPDVGRDRAIGKRFIGQHIFGSKRLTYSRRGNPWRQLMEVRMREFPQLATFAATPVLKLDTGYLARQGMPLLRIVGQQDQPAALADLASLALYLLRMLVQVHVWSMRAPDEARPRKIERLPSRVPGLPAPEIKELCVDRLPTGMAVMIRLTRYRFGGEQRARALQAKPGSKLAIETPVLLIHGYSASGTTFAHHSVRPNLASALWDAGRDVWIVDMRTSAGMPLARHGWSFEDAACSDIPSAIEHVCAATGKQLLDIVAHCMGSAMLGMALLEESRNIDLHKKIRSLAMSQVAPAMIFTPANVFRAYAMRYLKHYLPIGDYEFLPTGAPSLVDQLVDRLLATLPYPEEEFDIENPFWTPWRRTPWVRTRHRMDALYGRDFSLKNIPQNVLDYIDDHFGPLSVDTVSQAIQFARFRTITTREGFNAYLNPQRLRERYDFPMLSVHGEDNGLVSVSTLDHFHKVVEDASAQQLLRARFKDFGHQDCLIGTGAPAVFRRILDFFDSVSSRQCSTGNEPSPVFASQVPAYGVRLDPMTAASNILTFSVGDHGGRGRPWAGVFVPVSRKDGRYLLVDESEEVEPDETAFVRLLKASEGKPIEELDRQARLKFDVPGNLLPANADGLLVMLLYLQTSEIGLPVSRPFGEVLTTLQALESGQAEPAPECFGLPEFVTEFLPTVAGQSRKGTGRRSIAAPGSQAQGQGSPGNPAIDRIVKAIACSVHREFHDSTATGLSVGLVCPPRPQKSVAVLEPQPYCFALASCQYPGGMLDATPRGIPEFALPGPADASYLRLNHRLAASQGDRPSLLILAGDQVYVDATAGLFDPKVLDERFHLAYERFLGGRGPRSVLGRVRAHMLLDDHEIEDNWEPDPAGARPRTGESNDIVRRRGVQAYMYHQRDAHIALQDTPQLWRSELIDGFAFFLADTRTERSPRKAATAGTAKLIGDDQFDALERWLDDKSLAGPRFIVSSSMVLPRKLATRDGGAAAALRSDSWDGYPASLHRLLGKVYERGLDDVVFLSGDEHLGNVSHIALKREDTDKEVVAHSIHCPALYAPYPFANSISEDFARQEHFAFANYRCTVTSWFPTPGDGFVVLSVLRNTDGWCVTVEFDAAPARDDRDVERVKKFRIPGPQA